MGKDDAAKAYGNGGRDGPGTGWPQACGDDRRPSNAGVVVAASRVVVLLGWSVGAYAYDQPTRTRSRTASRSAM